MRRVGHAAIFVALLSVGLFGCDGLGSTPVTQPLPVEVIDEIKTAGLVVRPAIPLAGVVPPRVIMATARDAVGPNPDQPVYVEAMCVDARKCVSWTGFTPGQMAGVWVVTFPGLGAGNGPPANAWALFDARTGDLQLTGNLR